MLHDSNRVCLLAFPTHKPATPVAIIAAALHVPTDDLSFAPAPSVDMLALGVLPSHRRKHLGAHLVSVAWRELALPAAAAGLKTPRLRASSIPRPEVVMAHSRRPPLPGTDG